MIHVEGLLFHGFARFVLAGVGAVERVFGWVFAILGVECSTLVIANVCSIGVRLAALTRHTLRLWALTRPSAQPTVPGQGEQAFNPGIVLMMCVTHVVIGHG